MLYILGNHWLGIYVSFPLPISFLRPELSIFWNSELGHNQYESHLNSFPSTFCPIYSSKFKIKKEKSINLEDMFPVNFYYNEDEFRVQKD